MLTAVSTQLVPTRALVRAAAQPDEWPDAGLLVPAASDIADGTSNTMMLTTPAGRVRAAAANASLVWKRPNELKVGCGLLLPATARLRFQPGAVLPSLLILPHIEQDNLYEQYGITLEQVRVAGVARIGADLAVWLVPAGIIAVLIGL
jgi:hypothetical protein